MRLGESASMYAAAEEEGFVPNPSPTECDEIIVSFGRVDHFVIAAVFLSYGYIFSSSTVRISVAGLIQANAQGKENADGEKHEEYNKPGRFDDENGIGDYERKGMAVVLAAAVGELDKCHHRKNGEGTVE